MFRNPVTDLIVVLVVALLIFGPKRLPLLGRSLGQGLREFKDSISGSSRDEEEQRPALGAAAPTQSIPTQTAAEPAGGQPAASPAPPAASSAAHAPSTGVASAEAGSSEQRS